LKREHNIKLYIEHTFVTRKPMMRNILLAILLLGGIAVSGQKKHVCFTIDDLPVVSYGEYDTIVQQRIMNNLILSLKKNKIPAIGFVIEQNLYNDKGLRNPFEIHLLNQWLNNGFALGNHTYSHPDYSAISFREYAHEILQGEIITKEILRRKGLKPTYFRAPYLHVGNTKAKADSLSTFLTEHGYTMAPVTIDDEDYAFAYAYYQAKAQNDTALAARVGRDYLSYMETAIHYYEAESNRLLGRYINQIVLLHASRLNSEYIPALAAIFKKNGYDFIDIKKTLKDPAYQSPITIYGDWGSSWIERWALSQGKKENFFYGLPAPIVPDYIRKIVASAP
jgi:peptidoglycan/xylan/chitin deacetylase (PgdA/CDA1 family)